MKQLEVLEDPKTPGFYMVQRHPYPGINANSVEYVVDEFKARVGFISQLHPSLKQCVVDGWFGPIAHDDLDIFDTPTEEGYYVGLLQPWPNQSPTYHKLEVLVWRRGNWYDKYGWAKQYGNVYGWIGPFPMLVPAQPWVAQHEKELAEEIGL
jgi:hypothetical protein